MLKETQAIIKYCVVLLTLGVISLLPACKSPKQAKPSKAPKAEPSLYLGQKPPGLEPEPFAPGMVSTEHYEYGGTFTPDLQEFYFNRVGGKYEEMSLVVIQNKEGEWQESTVSKWVGQAVISPDGKVMHLGRRYKERTATGWSEVKELGPPFEDIPIMRLSASAKGTYFFDTYIKDQPDYPLRFSRRIKGKHETPQTLGPQINTGIKNLNHPFIAPDESYLIWDAVKEGGFGSSDLYISFKQSDGTWGPTHNLGEEINTEAWEASASVTPDGKYLFFSRNMGSDEYENVDIFWVDARILEKFTEK